MFDIISPRHSGFLALESDGQIDKKTRGAYLTSGAELGDETTFGYEDHIPQKLVEPGNALFWKHSQTGQLAPRGAWGSWSFAMPTIYMGQDEFQPMETDSAVDNDFEKEKAAFAGGWGGTPPVGTKAIVVATTKHGGHQKVAFFSGGQPLIAHWLGNQPPVHSRHVFDIMGDEIDPDRHAGLDTIFRVRKWAPPCSRGTGSVNTQQYTIALTGNASPEGQGFLNVTFGDIDALFSYMMSGPLVPSFAGKHLLSRTGDSDLVAGAISTNAYFRGSSMPYTAPLRFEEEIYPTVQNGEIPYEVHLQYDPAMKHPFKCADKQGMWRWFVKLPMGETPPCKPTKDYASLDANGNPSRTWAGESRVFINKQVQSTGIYFQPRPQLIHGRP